MRRCHIPFDGVEALLHRFAGRNVALFFVQLDQPVADPHEGLRRKLAPRTGTDLCQILKDVERRCELADRLVRVFQRQVGFAQADQVEPVDLIRLPIGCLADVDGLLRICLLYTSDAADD